MKIFINFFAFLLFSFSYLQAQNITFGFANKVVTATSVGFDVTLVSSSSFKLGSGQIYLNYNPAAFGSNVNANGNGKITISQPNGSVLSQGWYGSFITNDNTASRVSFSWQQVLSAGYFTDNISSTAVTVFHVDLEFQMGGNTEPDNICFESGAIFDDQTFTACGPHTTPPTFPSFDLANCTNFPGTNISNDNYDCSFTVLPVELIYFEAQTIDDDKVALFWQTASERNNDYFLVEHSVDGRHFKQIEKVKGTGTTDVMTNYKTFDKNPFNGINYYRLKQIDFDGAFEYSNIIAIKFENGVGDLEVFPNPTRGKLYFNTPLDGQLTVFDILGQMVWQQNNRANMQNIDLSSLPAATYFLENIALNGQSNSVKVVISKP